MYVMAAVGILGVLAKIVNRMTLYRLIKAAGNMPKSTHKLMKLVKAKYEHACMAHESVENVGVFVEKYIYEYRGFLFRIHTWRQIELLSVWFVGILAVIGAALSYMEGGLTETVYQYIAGGAAEAVLLMVIIRMSDEPYKIKAIKMYMVDYLENVCAVRVRRQNRKEKENHLEIKLSEIGSMELKTKMDFWDTLYAALFGVMFLMNITDVAWLLLIAVFLYTGYGKVLNLKMKNGLNFEIPVNGMTEDVEQFRLLIGKE